VVGATLTEIPNLDVALHAGALEVRGLLPVSTRITSLALIFVVTLHAGQDRSRAKEALTGVIIIEVVVQTGRTGRAALADKAVGDAGVAGECSGEVCLVGAGPAVISCVEAFNARRKTG
jgi:hypothetical protein